MKDWDISENQYWILIWAGLFSTIIIVALVISHNVNLSKQLAAEQIQAKMTIDASKDQNMLEKGYIQVIQSTCIQNTTDRVWVLKSDSK